MITEEMWERAFERWVKERRHKKERPQNETMDDGRKKGKCLGCNERRGAKSVPRPSAVR